MKPTNRRTCTTTFLAASLVAFAALGASAAPSYKATLTVSGYTGSTTLENFPVLVRITEYDFSTGRGIEGFSYSDCAADGADLSFVAADGETILPHEIDTWETTGESLVWVRLPSLSGTDTTFTMRWADDDPPPVTKSDVWTGAGYKSVWHLDIVDSATADAVAGYAGTVKNPSDYCGAGAGLLGGGYHNEDNVDKCHNVYTMNVAGFTPVSGTATYSAWAKQIGGTAANGFPDQATYPKIKWASAWGNCGAIWNSKDGGNKVGIGTGGIELCLEGKANMINTMYVRDSKATIGTLTMDTIYDKQWHYLVVTYDGTMRRFYVDGVIQPRFTGSCTIDTPEGTVRMGARDDANKDCVWTGDLDEMRFRGACSSADWISAEYANIASDTFIVYGPAQAGDNSVWVKGSPSEIGAPTPAYGFTTGLSAGRSCFPWQRLPWRAPARPPTISPAGSSRPSIPRRGHGRRLHPPKIPARPSTPTPARSRPIPSSPGCGRSATPSASGRSRLPRTAVRISISPSTSPASAMPPEAPRRSPSNTARHRICLITMSRRL